MRTIPRPLITAASEIVNVNELASSSMAANYPPEGPELGLHPICLVHKVLILVTREHEGYSCCCPQICHRGLGSERVEF